MRILLWTNVKKVKLPVEWKRTGNVTKQQLFTEWSSRYAKWSSGALFNCLLVYTIVIVVPGLELFRTLRHNTSKGDLSFEVKENLNYVNIIFILQTYRSYQSFWNVHSCRIIQPALLLVNQTWYTLQLLKYTAIREQQMYF